MTSTMDTPAYVRSVLAEAGSHSPRHPEQGNRGWTARWKKRHGVFPDGLRQDLGGRDGASQRSK